MGWNDDRDRMEYRRRTEKKLMTFEVSVVKYEAFDEAVKRNGTTKAEVLRQLMDDYIYEDWDKLKRKSRKKQ